MSSPLAIGAVSAVLRNLLDNGLDRRGAPLGPVKVTAVAPDTIKLDDPDAEPSLNLFLYRTSRNQGWRNAGLPAFDGNGSRISNPPLALNLHYLLTAYGSADFQAEILLGYAMHLLHERPVLDRAAIRTRARPEPARRVDPAAGVPGAGRLRPRRPGSSGHDHGRADGHRGDVAALVGDPGALPADRGYLVSVVLIEARKPTRRRPAGALARRPGDRTRGRGAGRRRAPRACCRPCRRRSRAVPPTRSRRRASARPCASRAHHLDGTGGSRALRAPAARRAERGRRSGRAPTRGIMT